jgi:hypothetical protein
MNNEIYGCPISFDWRKNWERRRIFTPEAGRNPGLGRKG